MNGDSPTSSFDSCPMVQLISKSANYPIQPNYHTVPIGFSKMLGKLVVKYVPTYTKGTLRKDLSNNAYAMFLYVFFFF